MAVAVAVALLWPKTYRSVCLVMVTPPKYSETLVVPPRPLDMKTVDTIANSYQVLQNVLTKVQTQKNLLERAEKKILETDDSPRPWRKIANLSTQAAASLLQEELSEDFRQAWEDLPPENLLPGYLEFEDDDFEDVDPLVLSEYLSTRIQTKLQTRLRVEYQPVLLLSADGRTEKTAAILAYCWAQTFLLAFESDYLSPTLAR